jgi:hypothetical protein
MPENGDVVQGDPNLPPMPNIKNNQAQFGQGLKARSEGGYGMVGGQAGKGGKSGSWAKHPEGGAQGSGKPKR